MYAVQCNSHSRYLPSLLIIIRAIHRDSTATIATHSLIDTANCYFEIFFRYCRKMMSEQSRFYKSEKINELLTLASINRSTSAN